MSFYRRSNIETLSEQLESLQITDKASESTNNYINEMSNTLLAQVNENI